MSYARFGWDGSDVYVFTGSDSIECCGCILQERVWHEDPERSIIGGYLEAVGEIIQTRFGGPTANEDMIAHLRVHQAAGHHVPEDALEQLRDPQDAIWNQELWAKYAKEKESKP